jgi:hypothetical protein
MRNFLSSRGTARCGNFVRDCFVGALLSVALGGATAPAPAETPPAQAWKQTTSKQLAAACHSTDPAQHGMCLGYVTGIYDLQFASTPQRGICPPSDFTPALLAQVVTAYADTHDDGPAAAAIGQAIVRFFPCTEPRR